MRIIDAHVHLYPAEANRDPAGWARAQGEPDWAGLCTRRRKNGGAVQSFPSTDELLREMDRAGVARAVLLGWYWAKPETCAWQNRFYAECGRAHPDRLSAFATVQPGAGRAAVLTELRRATEEGLVGIGELSPHAQAHTMADDGFGAVLEFAAERRLPVTLHVTDPNSRDYPGRVETPLEDFAALAQARSSVNFILAHWGGLLPLRDASAARLSNVYYDSAASPLMYDDSIWRRFLAVVPAERVLFGSDFPLNVYPKLERVPGMVRLLDEAKSAGVPDTVMGGNVTRLLGL
ncbi:amidohydrolase family protein [Opitutus terrae]|uniref:Amidohydrolase 2 n=1 Tax=Opitutus terrae (strain DSM 11246 / JCM 15787 / PB90-1) TaxID=452637 RepID=B1ZWA7_OPITP|nr:amidohydrolase family protein [Opitutus terrae]ACB76859.1 amidohydrolase 2 [Opitutus terrae PB90-1]